MPKEKTIARWLPLVGLTFAVFVFNTSEFMPIGLLSDIAADLHISEVRAGLLVSVYAWVVALMSLPLMVMVSTVELKRLLLAIIALFVVSHVASALAEGYYTLMLSRIGVACAHSIFWSIAPPLAVRTVPDGRSALGLSTIATGMKTNIIAEMTAILRNVILSPDVVTMVLIVFGASGMLGSIAFSKYYMSGRRRFMFVVTLGPALCLLLMQAAVMDIIAIFGVCIVWGAMATAFNIACQDNTIRFAPKEATSIAMSIFSGIFNLGIGSGTWLGGLLCTYISITFIGFAEAVKAVHVRLTADVRKRYSRIGSFPA